MHKALLSVLLQTKVFLGILQRKNYGMPVCWSSCATIQSPGKSSTPCSMPTHLDLVAAFILANIVNRNANIMHIEPQHQYASVNQCLSLFIKCIDMQLQRPKCLLRFTDNVKLRIKCGCFLCFPKKVRGFN